MSGYTRLVKMILGITVIIAFLSTCPVISVAEDAAAHPGVIRGTVIDAVTSKPIEGAVIDIADSRNKEWQKRRHKGRSTEVKSDKDGRFVIEGFSFREKHQVVVIHPKYVRQYLRIDVLAEEQEPNLEIIMEPAGTIDVEIVDANGNPFKGFGFIRLKSLDNYYLHNYGKDLRDRFPEHPKISLLIWPRADGIPNEMVFDQLAEGDYSVDVMKFILSKDIQPYPGLGVFPFDSNHTEYHGGAVIQVKAGETKTIVIKPEKNETILKINIPEGPIKKSQLPAAILISRNLGLLLWDDGMVHGPSHPQAGRLAEHGLLFGQVNEAETFTVRNLPAGKYTVFGGPIFFWRGQQIELAKGRTLTIDAPEIKIEESKHSKIFPHNFKRLIKLEAKQYTLAKLCELITANTDSTPKIIVDQSIAKEKVELSDDELPIWNILESVYLDTGFTLIEKDDKTLIFRPAAL